ncbi:MAG: transporter related [Clostridiales bacterium]|nr:transporter related [Clostridiales bacterium]
MLKYVKTLILGGNQMKELLLKRKKRFMLYVLACFLPVINTLLQNLSFALLIGSIQVGKIDYFIKVFALTIFFVLIGELFYITSRFMRIGYMRDTILDVRIGAFEKILKHSFESFNKKSKDTYISNLINDINTFEQNFFLKLLNVIFNIGVYTSSLAILFFLDYKFALGIFVISLLMFLLTRSFENKTVKLQDEVSENNEKFTLDISNTFNGLEVLKLNSVEDKFLYKSLKAVDQVERKKFHYTVFTEGQRSLTRFLSYFIFIGVLIYSINLTFSGGSITTIVLMVQLANSCIWPIGNALPMFNDLKASKAIYEKITKIDIEDNNIIKKEKDFIFNSNIDVCDLKFSYEGKEIFKGLSFKIEKGKKYLLKGASGAGKSTLTKLLSMTYDNYDGSIKLDGTNYREINEKNFNKHISFIYQDVFLFEDTIMNNITLFKDIPSVEVINAVEKSGLGEFIDSKASGLQEMLMENGKNLSGGQRQRISIARAIIKNADILFVDEGTSGLNDELGRAVEDTILSLDSTVIAISHRYYEGITEKYDYILELSDGIINQYTGFEYFEGVAI